MIGDLRQEMDRLLRTFIVKFVQMRCVKSCLNLKEKDFKTRENQHQDDKFAVGMNTRSLLVDAVANYITPTIEQKFFANVKAFYEAAVQKMIQKFPFSDRVLKDLVILDHRKREDLDYSHAACIAERFYLDFDQEELKEEWTDFQLMTDEQLPSLQQDKLSTDTFWGTLLNMNTSLNVPRFPLMQKLLSVLLCLPHSNADSERVFSQVRKINTEYGKRMEYETLTALLQVKMNCDGHCFQFSPTKDMLCAAKDAAKVYNQQHSH